MSTPTDETTTWTAPLGRIPSGMFIVTAREGTQETGMLASWIQQCSFRPPCLSLAVKPGRGLAALLSEGCAFTVHVLAEGQTHLVKHFGQGFAPNEPAFAGVHVHRPEGEAPEIPEALAILRCRLRSRLPAGDHDLVIGEIVSGDLPQPGKPMIHVRNRGTHY